MIGRAAKILSRFPAHLEAARPDKRFAEVTSALATDLDVLSAAAASVRRAHRLGHADVLGDLLRLATLHGLGKTETTALFDRWTLAEERLAAVTDALAAEDDTARDAAAEALLELWGLAAAAPRLPIFAPPPAEGEGEGGEPPDLTAAGERLQAVVADSLSYRGLLDAVRARIATTAMIHARGNGTVGALLAGAANVLDLELVPGSLVHSDDRFWHAARVRDRQRLRLPEGDELAPADDILGLEENPRQRQTSERIGRSHGELFSILRRGFDRVTLSVEVIGRDDRTVAPILVNRDEGRGVGFTGSVAAGQVLSFSEEGRVYLDGVEVTAQAYSFVGGCFAGEDASRSKDFVFAGPELPIAEAARIATFATSRPAAALASEASFPHAGAPLTLPSLAVGETRFAFFVQEAHFSSAAAGGEVRLVPPRPAVGFFDGSVFAPGANESRQMAAELQLAWLEHEAYAVRILIPQRFAALDNGSAPSFLDGLTTALDRFRPAGVDVRAEFIDDRWVLGRGALPSGEPDLIDLLQSGMVLWSTPAPEGEG